MMTVRVSTNLTAEENVLVTYLAAKHGRSKSDVVRRALAIQKLYEELAPNGTLEVCVDGRCESIYMPW
jgi:hypothetical protein